MRVVTPTCESTFFSQLDVLLPTEFRLRTNTGRIPEVRLLAAILFDALQCIAGNPSAGGGRHKRQYRDACAWVFEEPNDGWPFAFENVCGVLGLDPAAVRLRVQEILEPSWARSVWTKRFPVARSTLVSYPARRRTIPTVASQ